jgi:hypothetical protein
LLAELAAANAAYSTIKKFIVNGKEVSDFLAPLKNLVGAEEELKARGNRKSNGLFAKIMGKTGNDFDEFMALEKLFPKYRDQLIMRPEWDVDMFYFKSKLLKLFVMSHGVL